jgi:hypothetical protein
MLAVGLVLCAVYHSQRCAIGRYGMRRSRGAWHFAQVTRGCWFNSTGPSSASLLISVIPQSDCSLTSSKSKKARLRTFLIFLCVFDPFKRKKSKLFSNFEHQLLHE